VTDRSGRVLMPRTAQDVTSDLHDLLTSANVPGPYILVGHSLGGLFVRLYAQTYPDEVSGLVLVDAFPVGLPAQLGSQWSIYRPLVDKPLLEFTDNPDFEQIDIDASILQIRQALPLRRTPLVVLTKTERFAIPPNQAGLAVADLERAWMHAERPRQAPTRHAPRLRNRCGAPPDNHR
jgi:pimeloyl-ACP methyl ester carboxylesterase